MDNIKIVLIELFVTTVRALLLTTCLYSIYKLVTRDFLKISILNPSKLIGWIYLLGGSVSLLYWFVCFNIQNVALLVGVILILQSIICVALLPGIYNRMNKESEVEYNSMYFFVHVFEFILGTMLLLR